MDSPISYRNYLDFLEEKAAFPLRHKIAAGATILLFIIVGALTTSYYQYKKDLPKIAKYNYLQETSQDFAANAQSLNDVLNAFKIAGQKVQIVGNDQEPQAAASSFFVAMDDLEKTSQLIGATTKNIESQKAKIEESAVPQELADLKDQITNFYDQSATTLSTLNDDQEFARQLILASGPKFYQPTLTDESLWESPDKKKIIDYYGQTKVDANAALGQLATLSPPAHFQQYYEAQIEYLSRLVTLSDNIINTLAVADDPNRDVATQIEKAYQYLTIAKKENETTAKRLFSERLKLVDIQENLNKLAPVQLQKNSTAANLKLEIEQTPKVEPNLYFQTIYTKSQSIFTGFTNTYTNLIKL
ncbi:MAG TPA: hypothetical protein VLE91_04915 [Candidatus Saccharimonadales bacterium]|nr:hypothetical protein [Candidatus Saccharimonadales bacterium]